MFESQSAAVVQELKAIGIPEEAVGRTAIPFMLIGSAARQIFDLGGDTDMALGLLDDIADVDGSDPYWLESPTPDTSGDEAVRLDQAVRFLRVCYNELWEVVLDFDESYDATAPEDDAVALGRVEASRMTALEAMRLLVKLAFQAMPARAAVGDDPAP